MIVAGASAPLSPAPLHQVGLIEMNDRSTELNQQFSIDGIARFDAGPGGLTRLLITTDKANATIHPHGAHVSQFQPRGSDPILWMSNESYYAAGKAIRGGVPLVFPWFGPHPAQADAPAHGLVRTIEWEVADVSLHDDGDVSASFLTTVESFRVVYRVTVGPALRLEMTVTNDSAESVVFEQAFHTYLTVGDVRRISVHGLDGVTYIDKLDESSRKIQPDSPVTFEAETDSVYLDTEAAVRIQDPTLNRTIAVSKQGSRSTVVWNPWIAKAKRMPDFGDDEWPGMVCIESGNIADDSVRLEPGGTHTMIAKVGIA